MQVEKVKVLMSIAKTGLGVLVSHLDLQRLLIRTLRRSGLPIYYTKGFNPHPKLSFYSSLKLGSKA